MTTSISPGIDIPEQRKLTSSLINNIGIAVAGQGGDATHTGIAMLRRAMALNPLDLGPRINLANFLVTQGHDDESEQLVTFVLKHDERNAVGWQLLGVIN